MEWTPPRLRVDPARSDRVLDSRPCNSQRGRLVCANRRLLVGRRDRRRPRDEVFNPVEERARLADTGAK